MDLPEQRQKIFQKAIQQENSQDEVCPKWKMDKKNDKTCI